ncbi:MAG: PLDc N-terminal domain-containing protein, partial [Methanoculleus sp.]
MGWIILPLNVIFAIIIVFFERKEPTETIAWLVVLFLLPPVGFVLYLLLGQNYTRQRMFVVKEREDRSFLQEIFAEQQRTFVGDNYRCTSPEVERFNKTVSLLLQNSQAYLTGGNRVGVFTRGEDKFEALFAAIGEARHHIHMEYFIINNDDLGRAV